MSKSKIIVLRSAGTNCDQETASALRNLGAHVDSFHINKLANKEINLLDYRMLVISGGFSYGDDISAGKVLATELKFRLKDELFKFADSNRLILGICNGFQVLIKTGLLPGLDGIFDEKQYATLTLNDSNKFECRWVHLKKVNTSSPFLKYVPEIINIPSAHAEGKFLAFDEDILQKIEEQNLVAFRYCDESSKPAIYPKNPNGAVNNIAGICNSRGNILGMMPHPERAFHVWQTPDWTIKKAKGIAFGNEFADGFHIFKSAIEYIENNF